MTEPELKDLSTINPGPTAASSQVPQIQPPSEKPYDPSPERENVRGKIALLLLWTLVAAIAVVILVGLITTYQCNLKDACTADTVELKSIRAVAELVLTPLIGLVGAVTGFYFGASAKQGG